MTRPQRWSLRHRHAEGGPWSEAAAGPRGALGDELLAPAFACALGDLVALHAPGGSPRGLWVETGAGLVAAPPPPGRRPRPNWLARLLDAGMDPRYAARRIVRMAWEDIGLADPRAMQIANDAALTYERLGSPEGELALAQAVVYLALAPKSNAVYAAYKAARAAARSGSSGITLASGWPT